MYSLDVLLSQFWSSPFIVARLFLTVASWPAYRFLKRQVKWSGIPISFRMVQTVKRLPAMQETQVWSPGWEDPLEKEMATHSSTLA